MMEWLTGEDRRTGGHARYARPGDYSFAQCQGLLQNAKRSELRQAWDKVRFRVL